MIYVGLAIKL